MSSTKWAKTAVSRPFLPDKEKVGAAALCLGACKTAEVPGYPGHGPGKSYIIAVGTVLKLCAQRALVSLFAVTLAWGMSLLGTNWSLNVSCVFR